MLDLENERRVYRKIEQLRNCAGDYQQLHSSLKEKRLRWWEENKDRLNLTGSLPRQAYTLVLLEYMKIDPSEVPVVYEDEKRIVWESYNFCPILEACQREGLDTRTVCKEGMEESVQDLISCLNPNLRFTRDYENLRPYGKCCRETVWLDEPEAKAA